MAFNSGTSLSSGKTLFFGWPTHRLSMQDCEETDSSVEHDRIFDPATVVSTGEICTRLRPRMRLSAGECFDERKHGTDLGWVYICFFGGYFIN